MTTTSSDALTLHRYKRLNQAYTEALSKEVSLTLMLIPAGEFVMGASKKEKNSHDSERPQHTVTASKFLMGRYPVTQAQWRTVAGYNQVDRALNPAPSRFKGDNLPVERVSWDGAQEFCRRLSVKTGKDYRLPSESEWEYACRAGTTTAYHFGDTLPTELANFARSLKQTSEVDRYPANRWGLHDMHGNVWEWCQDYWHDSYEDAPPDGSAWLAKEADAKELRVLRGGSWFNVPGYCRSAFRYWFAPDDTYGFVGFRVVCGGAR